MSVSGYIIADDSNRAKYPDQFIIADAKRGDIGNTAALYARTFFETMDFDAVTAVANHFFEAATLSAHAGNEQEVARSHGANGVEVLISEILAIFAPSNTFVPLWIIVAKK